MDKVAIGDRHALTRLHEQGYAVLEDFFSLEEDIAPVLAEFEEVLGSLVDSLVQRGELHASTRGRTFSERFLAVAGSSQTQIVQYFDFSLPQTGIRPDTPFHFGPAVFSLVVHQRLLDLLETEIGEEILLNPVGHVRMKPPLQGVPERSTALMNTTPWHQDNGAVLPEADETRTLTVWIPLTEATPDNGCLQVVSGSHRKGLLDHCPTGNGTNSAIPQRQLDENRIVSLPMRPGSALVMDPRLAHSSLPNQTHDDLRISLDLRYQPAGQPTGRPQFPGVLVRSRQRPDEVVRTAAEWEAVWLEARSRLSKEEVSRFHRWDANSSVCA